MSNAVKEKNVKAQAQAEKLAQQIEQVQEPVQAPAKATFARKGPPTKEQIKKMEARLAEGVLPEAVAAEFDRPLATVEKLLASMKPRNVAEYSFPVRPGVSATFLLPNDLTSVEAQRLSTILAVLGV